MNAKNSNQSALNITTAKQDKEYLSVRELSIYASLGERTIWSFLKDATNPLPYIKIGKKIVRVKRTDFDLWIKSFYAAKHPTQKRIEKILNSVISDFSKKQRERHGR